MSTPSTPSTPNSSPSPSPTIGSTSGSTPQGKAPVLDHPVFALVKQKLPGRSFKGTEFRGQSTLIVSPKDLHETLALLRDDPSAKYEFLSDVIGIDYLGYPSKMPGRFAVVYNLISLTHDDRLFVKVFLDPSLPTTGTAVDPALEVDSATDLWPGAEWPEREAYDMFGIRFKGHPDLRRILLWEEYPGHPLRKDYPLRGRGEREQYAVIDRTSA